MYPACLESSPRLQRVQKDKVGKAAGAHARAFLGPGFGSNRLAAAGKGRQRDTEATLPAGGVAVWSLERQYSSLAILGDTVPTTSSKRHSMLPTME